MFRRARGTHQWVWLLCTNWCTNSTKIHLSYQESYPVVYLGLLCLTRHLLCTCVDIHSAHFHSSFGCIFTRPSLLSLSQAVLIDAPTVLKLHLVYKVHPIRFSLSPSPSNKPLFTHPILFTWLLSASSTSFCPSPDFSNTFLVSQQPPNFYSAPCKECLLTWSSNNCIYHNSHNHNHHNPHNHNQNHNHNHHNSPHHRNDFLCAGSLNGVRDGDWLRQNI